MYKKETRNEMLLEWVANNTFQLNSTVNIVTVFNTDMNGAQFSIQRETEKI